MFGNEREYAFHVSMCSQADQDNANYNDQGKKVSFIHLTASKFLKLLYFQFSVMTPPLAKTAMESPTLCRGFKCSKCPKVFMAQVNLKRHVSQSHSSGLSVHCNKCPARFSSLIALNKHIATHSNSPRKPAESPPSSNECAVMRGKHLLQKGASKLKKSTGGIGMKGRYQKGCKIYKYLSVKV